MTILESTLNFVGASIASGITWDLLKTLGTEILSKFKLKFISEKYFKDENQCDAFLEIITNKDTFNDKKPLRDVQNVYVDITENETIKFVQEYELWLKENKEDFEKLILKFSQTASVNIGNQTNTGSGNIINTGIWNGNIGR
ncbi:hypothetical protein [Anaerotignum propionicum]|uniref:Uncharacterized protein n=1 Tax=Anaerotignum propionicum DSM 1682 TaxID=991789 RepID=A0A0X1U7U9_ANAPI|nr:hypothetical protein [Anaerotignum propionicum]AMJ41008.1 hypothetical protein CPRO_14150 [Anaerotignum propionicum DSM 1682]SHE61181.1 hypothetical protein SAMN02745151_01226 [[Clostridium] propionicum DSM 1682] [Anaerotignum propionicum DSM 1682]